MIAIITVVVLHVLIETYWNVKGIDRYICHKCLSRINRNILECKEHIGRDKYRKDFVLIETYWNVKLKNVLYLMNRETVLIETYWNVKYVERVTRAGKTIVLIETYWNVKIAFNAKKSDGFSINRNILECKEMTSQQLYIPRTCINRNILECKVTRRRRTLITAVRINRNILECKGKRSCLFEKFVFVLIETYWNVKMKSKGKDRQVFRY